MVDATGFDVNSKSKKGMTLLHIAVSAGRLPMVQWLLRHNASISVTDRFGRTAEGLARMSGGFPFPLYPSQELNLPFPQILRFMST